MKSLNPWRKILYLSAPLYHGRLPRLWTSNVMGTVVLLRLKDDTRFVVPRVLQIESSSISIAACRTSLLRAVGHWGWTQIQRCVSCPLVWIPRRTIPTESGIFFADKDPTLWCPCKHPHPIIPRPQPYYSCAAGDSALYWIAQGCPPGAIRRQVLSSFFIPVP